MSERSGVSAFPAKRFFVEMLVRDIELSDAILDLLDNCVDGAVRSLPSAKVATHRPYEGCCAKIDFGETSFSITDNCGGISKSVAEHAFRMGRLDRNRDEGLATVGVYGIGMKRAIFKMGRHSTVESMTAEGSFTVPITREWMEDDDAWDLPLLEGECSLQQPGTRITVSDLREGLPRIFSTDTDFDEDLMKAISAYYAIIIEKGFRVEVNGKEVRPHQVALQFDDAALTDSGIAPYVYQAEENGVKISLVVGFYRKPVSEDEEEDELSGKPSSSKAGVTIVCNDRVVVHADRTRMTGWGETPVPQYHTQFISIAGYLEFVCADATKLPLTTTKRGVDGNSELYLTAKDFLREGLKLFTDHTNRWKGATSARAAFTDATVSVRPRDVAARIPATSWSKSTKGFVEGRKFKPSLPVPAETNPIQQIRFSRSKADIAKLASYLFDDALTAPSEVGGKCFDDALAKANK